MKQYHWADKHMRYKSKQLDKWATIIVGLSVLAYAVGYFNPSLPNSIRALCIPLLLVGVLLQFYSIALYYKDKKIKRIARVIPPSSPPYYKG